MGAGFSGSSRVERSQRLVGRPRPADERDLEEERDASVRWPGEPGVAERLLETRAQLLDAAAEVRDAMPSANQTCTSPA